MKAVVLEVRDGEAAIATGNVVATNGLLHEGLRAILNP